MKLNKVLPFLLLLLSLSFISCGTGMGSDKETNNDTTIMNKVSILCTSDIIVPSRDGFRANGASSTESVETLSFIEDGKVKPFTFTSPSNKTFVLANRYNSYDDSPLKKFNNNTVAYGYDTAYQVTKDSEGNLKYTPVDINVRNIALIDLKTSEVYDFNEYNIHNAQSNKDYIFANSNPFRDQQCFYKISMKTKKGTPISIDTLRDFFVYDDNRIIEYTYSKSKIHFINEEKLPEYVNNISYINKGETTEYPNIFKGWGGPYLIRNNKDEILVFALNETKYLLGKLDVITNEKENKIVVKDAVGHETLNNERFYAEFRVLTHSKEFSGDTGIKYFNDDEIIIVYEKTNSIVRLKITDTINVSFYDTTENLYNKNLSFNKDGIYFIEENKIMKYDYETKSIKEIYQTSSVDIQLADTLCVTDDLVIFYETTTAGGYVTCSLDKNGIKKQIATHQANVKQITKLDINKYL